MLAAVRDVRFNCLKALLRPIARYWLNGNSTVQDFFEATKQVFVEVAAEQLEQSGHRANVSRIAVHTGVHRPDVTRIYREGVTKQNADSNLLAKILGQWENDARFLTKSRAPKVLSADFIGSEFYSLVESVNKNINPGTILFQLERIGAVERTTRGVKLTQRVAEYTVDPQEGFKILSDNIDVAINCVSENLFNTPSPKNLHVSTEYDNVLLKKLPEIRAWFLLKGNEFHRAARAFVSQFDKDLNPNLKGGGGGKVCLVSVSHTASDEPS